ncbi:MAG TPA: hypothetical protein VJ720_06800 [Chitinophaga sp.]|nr:hypothetical protein [Chitinophaga sp.]
MKRLLILIIIVLKGILPVTAQEGNGMERAALLLKKAEQSYRSKPLAFTVKFTYSNEHTPGNILDSLSGSVEMDGSRYWYLLDSTETISNGKYNIILFREDRQMLISPVKADSMAGQNPVAYSSALLQKAGATGCQVSAEGRQKVLQVSFSEASEFKTVSIYIDTVVNRITAMRYVVKTTSLMDPGGEPEQLEGYEEYAIVKALYYDYREIKPGSERFNERRFFIKEGEEYTPAADYKEYRILFTTPKQ